MNDITLVVELPDGTYTVKTVAGHGLNASTGQFRTREEAEAAMASMTSTAGPAPSTETTLIKPGDGPGIR